MQNKNEIIPKLKEIATNAIDNTLEKIKIIADIIEEHPKATFFTGLALLGAGLMHHDEMEHGYKTEITTKHLHISTERDMGRYE